MNSLTNDYLFIADTVNLVILAEIKFFLENLRNVSLILSIMILWIIDNIFLKEKLSSDVQFYRFFSFGYQIVCKLMNSIMK